MNKEKKNLKNTTTMWN